MLPLEDRPNDLGRYGLTYFVLNEDGSKSPFSTSISAVSWADAQRQADDLGMKLYGKIAHIEGSFDSDEEISIEQCANCNDKIYIHSKCHPESPTWAIYSSERETVMIECAECRSELITFRLNPKSDK